MTDVRRTLLRDVKDGTIVAGAAGHRPGRLYVVLLVDKDRDAYVYMDASGRIGRSSSNWKSTFLLEDEP